MIEEAVPVANCKRCAHYTPTILFTLCNHESSKYKDSTEFKFHTIQHMRTKGACGSAAILYTSKTT